MCLLKTILSKSNCNDPEFRGKYRRSKKIKRHNGKDETPEDKEVQDNHNKKLFTKYLLELQTLVVISINFLGTWVKKFKGWCVHIETFGAGALLIGLIKFLESDYFDKFLDAVKGFMGFIDKIGEFLEPGGQLV